MTVFVNGEPREVPALNLADVRPAFPDNEPRIVERGGRIHVYGFYRHGFLLSPAFAEMAEMAVSRREKAA
jgi:glycine/D-amino acid oxidase-like deaminating enzyme